MIDRFIDIPRKPAEPTGPEASGGGFLHEVLFIF